MQTKIVAKPLALLSALMSVMFAPTPSASGTSDFGEQRICATGTCCPETGSLCYDGASQRPDHYYLKEGKCPGSN